MSDHRQLARALRLANAAHRGLDSCAYLDEYYDGEVKSYAIRIDPDELAAFLINDGIVRWSGETVSDSP